MKVVISYAREQRRIAEEISYAIAVRGYDVFFDQSNLKPGLEYDLAIQKAIDDCDLFVFLISPDSIKEESYTRTRAGIRQRQMEKPVWQGSSSDGGTDTPHGSRRVPARGDDPLS